MAFDVYDELPLWTMDAFDKFRDDRYNFLYLCKTCARAFDSKVNVEKCKFCGNSVVEIRSITRKKSFPINKEKRLFRYYCPLCEKNFLTSEKLTVCSQCRTDFMHVYTWDMLRKRDRLYIKLNKALKSTMRPQERAIREANIQQSDTDTKVNQNQHTAPLINKSLQPRPRFSLFGSRSKEEMPSY